MRIHWLVFQELKLPACSRSDPWYDGCNWCSCINAMVFCTKRYCPPWVCHVDGPLWFASFRKSNELSETNFTKCCHGIMEVWKYCLMWSTLLFDSQSRCRWEFWPYMVEMSVKGFIFRTSWSSSVEWDVTLPPDCMDSPSNFNEFNVFRWHGINYQIALYCSLLIFYVTWSYYLQNVILKLTPCKLEGPIITSGKLKEERLRKYIFRIRASTDL